MSITINSNILSLNAQRRLGQHTSNLRSSFEKLSSGLRVSKASDDAAGLSISENLKTDSKLSSQALRNVNDGISMVSIISGALESQKDILYRMSELAEQSANGVNSNNQRKALQTEYSSLILEFDRIADSATFNGISLLKNPDTQTISIMAGITGASESLLSVAAANSHSRSGSYAIAGDVNKDGTIDVNDRHLLNQALIGNYSGFNDIGIQGLPSIFTIQVNSDQGDIVEISAAFSITDSASGQGTPLGSHPTSTELNISWETETRQAFMRFTLPNANLAVSSFGFYYSDSSPITFFASIDISDIELNYIDDNSKNGHTSAIGFTSINDSTRAKISLGGIRQRIDEISQLQGSFGAVESRLNVAANRLQIDRENFQSAASQITDIDVATESSTLTRTQILQQAATSILAQANQQPQIALQLLGGL